MDKELVAHIVEHVKLANGDDGDDGEFKVDSPAAMLRLELQVHGFLMQRSADGRRTTGIASL